MKKTRIRWVGNVAHVEKKRNACKILAGNPQRKRPLGVPRLRWEDNIKLDFIEIE
jgi:hypothetical protein